MCIRDRFGCERCSARVGQARNPGPPTRQSAPPSGMSGGRMPGAQRKAPDYRCRGQQTALAT
eukprot:8636821-Alexandrium_andersonii.AAC.1